ncbi:MAG: CBS domain-containing protein [Thermoplasmata archaeon]|nr:CBS domain-containing protein [Thermoplasmata archaeon]
MDTSRITGMSVQNVMVRDVVTIGAGETIQSAWIKMVERNISSAPVLDESGDLVGIVSVSDIHRSVLARFREIDRSRTASDDVAEGSDTSNQEGGLAEAVGIITQMAVSSILPEGQTVISIGSLDSLERAIRIMGEKNVNLLPVLKDGRVAGVLSRQDVIWILSGKPIRRP